ncbi:MAG: hypothetical protein KAS32_06950 [Candidatus Peribacteraceae bacterium]|nr:hypothetical protein [Candidatus Peribacteraceae bacterium]
MRVTRDWFGKTSALTTTNGSDVYLLGEVKRMYQLYSVRASFTTSATVGDRQIELQFKDSDNTIVEVAIPQITQAADITYYYNFRLGPEIESIIDGDQLFISLPLTFMQDAFTLRLFDNNTIDTSGDLLIAHARYMIRDW